MKRLQWLVLVPAIAFMCQSCRNCRSDDLPVLLLSVQFQEDSLYMISGDLIETRQFLNNETLRLPVALDSDTTVYEIFNQQGRRWELAIAYDRNTGFEDTQCGFFLAFQNVRVLPAAGFSEVQIFNDTEVWSVWAVE